MNLPTEYVNRIKEIMEEKFSLYIDSFKQTPKKGIRVNISKIDKNRLAEFFNINKKVPFCKNGFYVDNNVSGNNPLHHAGAFYFQEPSAMSAVTALNPFVGERVLDMCAAPGGKTTQIADLVGEDGIVWSNEYIFKRTQILISNIERLGFRNTIVSSVDTALLAQKLPQFFDKVLVDAPCSGEGMMRKEPEAISNWSVGNINMCADRQQKILNNAAVCLKEGGTLCYSTCTFAPEENEMTIAHFLKNHPEFSLQKIEAEFGEPAKVKYAPDIENIEYCRRIFPWNGGEGHFVALMKKDGNGLIPKFKEKSVLNDITKIFFKFYNENFETDNTEIIFNIENKVYIKPNIPSYRDIGIVRMGVYCGEVVKNRFEPSHALFSAFGKKAKNVINFSLEDYDLYKFLHGEEIDCDNTLKGFTSVLVEGIPLGFGKASSGRLKNRYPKGLRILK